MDLYKEFCVEYDKLLKILGEAKESAASMEQYAAERAENEAWKYGRRLQIGRHPNPLGNLSGWFENKVKKAYHNAKAGFQRQVVQLRTSDGEPCFRTLHKMIEENKYSLNIPAAVELLERIDLPPFFGSVNLVPSFI